MTDLHDGHFHAQLRQEAQEWLVLLRSDDLSAEDMNRFAEWLATDGAHVAAFAEAEQLFAEMTVAATHVEMEKAPDATPPRRPALAYRPAGRPIRYRSCKRLGLTVGLLAACAGLLATSVMPLREWHWRDAFGSDYQTGIGEIREIILADGSKAILDTHSAISVDMDINLRHITLYHGRIHIQVKPDNQRPFEVTSEGVSVRALGTAFDILQREGLTQVTVQEHAVSVHLDNTPTAAVTIHEGEQLTFQEGPSLPSPQRVALDQASSWQQKRLMVSDRPLRELVDELARYRIGHIVLSDTALESQRVTGVFNLDHPDQALQTLCSALNLRRTSIGPWWVLIHR